ncbi:FixH family protein [Nibribacter koreensis]|uniref:FixH family protein n=1 Tax=Nibribacter koreensis TaxID=1084519 RepID=A0ABP8FFX1_9BACT
MSIHTNTPAVPKKSFLPYIIISAFLLFIAYIGMLVYGTMQSDVDLVSKDYYAKELAYNERMQQLSHAQQLDEPIQIIAAQAAGQLVVQFPAELKQATGSVLFFRPSNVKLDFEVPLKLNADGLQHFTTGNLEKGLWRVQVVAKVGDKEYYQQQDVTL